MTQTTLAALAVGGTVGLGTVAVLKKPLWAGLLLGAIASYVTVQGIKTASAGA